MKKVLISPNEIVKDPITLEIIGQRVVEIANNEFPVAEPLFWIDGPDDVTHEWFYADGQLKRPTATE